MWPRDGVSARWWREGAMLSWKSLSSASWDVSLASWPRSTATMGPGFPSTTCCASAAKFAIPPASAAVGPTARTTTLSWSKAPSPPCGPGCGMPAWAVLGQALTLARAYRLLGPCHDLFQPAMRLGERTCIREPGQRPRVRRRYDRAATPFDRLNGLGPLTPERQAEEESIRFRGARWQAGARHDRVGQSSRQLRLHHYSAQARRGVHLPRTGT